MTRVSGRAASSAVGVLRAHFDLDGGEADEDRRLCAAAIAGLASLEARLSAVDMGRVISALTGDVTPTPRAPRLMWRGMDRVYAPVIGEDGSERERFVTPDIEVRVEGVADIAGEALDALVALERGRFERFACVPCVASTRMIAGEDGPGSSLVIDSDNLKALRWLTPEYAGRVDLIYADPPYNSGERLFRYKDRYSPEAWLTMMRDRLALLAPMLAPTGAAALSINEAYGSELKLLCDEAFGREHFLTALTVRVRHEDRILKGARAFQDVTEQVLLYRGSSAFVPARRERAARDEEYAWGVSIEGAASRVETIGSKRVAFYAPGSFALTRGHAPDGVKRINIRGALRESNSSGRFFVAHLQALFETHRGWLIRVEGIGGDGLGYRDFVIPEDGPRRNADYLQGRPVGRDGGRASPYPNLVDFEKAFNRVAGEDDARFRNGKKPVALLRHIMTLTGIDTNPDAVVLDPFAGSGSTAAAVLSLNAEEGDGGRRRFVVIDRGEHLHSVAVPRLEGLLGGDAHGGHPVRLVTLRDA